MCGISAIISKSGIDISELISMNGLIEHRGPDGYGFAVFSPKHFDFWGTSHDSKPIGDIRYPYVPQSTEPGSTYSNYEVGLGHRRLSIIDLTSAGHMPMSKIDRYWITFNGEIYNYLEIKKELSDFGFTFDTDTDTEVILNAYIHWGESCLNHFLGMWAFIIYDRKEKTVFASRDNYGIKPLYFYQNGDAIYFASEIKQFTVLKKWKSILNCKRATDYLLHSMTDHTRETMFKGVYQLLPGESLYTSIDKTDFEEISVDIRKWFNPLVEKYKGSKEDAYKDFKRLFNESIFYHLRADVLVGTSLSGGLDSSSVAMEVSEQLARQGIQNHQKTFTAVNEIAHLDETKWAKDIIQKGNMDGIFVSANMNQAEEDFYKMVWHFDEPFQSLSPFLAYNIFKEAKRQNIKVLLNGQGADEYLGGYGQFTAFVQLHLLRKCNILGFWNNIKSQELYYRQSYRTSISKIFHALVPNWLRSFFSKLFKFNLDHHQYFNLNILGTDVYLSPNADIPFTLGDRQSVQKYYTLHNPLPKYLHWEDRNSMAHSVEARVPFVTSKLIEFVNSLPVSYLEHNNLRKLLLREGLKDILPPSISGRKDKIGYESSEEHWVKHTHTQWFRNQLIDAIAHSQGVLNENCLEYFDKMVVGEIRFSYLYWRMISFGAWMKRFSVGIEKND